MTYSDGTVEKGQYEDDRYMGFRMKVETPELEVPETKNVIKEET